MKGNDWRVTTRHDPPSSLYRFKYIDDEKGFGIITASNRWLSHGAIIELLSEMNAGAEFFSELRSHFRGWCKIARKSAHPAAMIGDMLLWLDRNLAMSPRIIEGDDFVLRVMSPPVDSEDRNELHRLVDLLFEDVLHKQKLINPRDGAAIREVFEIQRSGMKIRIYTDNREETIGNEGL